MGGVNKVIDSDSDPFCMHFEIEAIQGIAPFMLSGS